MNPEDQAPAEDTAPPVAKAEAKPAGPAPKKKTGLIVILAIVGVVIIGMAVATYLFLLKTGPDQVVRQYVAAEATDDYATMRKLLAKSSVALLPPEDKMPPKSATPKAKLPEMDIGKATVNGAKATVPVKIKSDAMGGYGGGDQSLTIVLVKEDGAWKVDLLATVQEEYKRRLGGMGGQPGMGGAPDNVSPPSSTPPDAGAAPQGAPPSDMAAPPAGAPAAPAPAPKAKAKKP